MRNKILLTFLFTIGLLLLWHNMCFAVYIEYNGNSYNLPDPPDYNGSYVCNYYNDYFYLINLPNTSGAYFYTPRSI